jgi:predicted membrane protein
MDASLLLGLRGVLTIGIVAALYVIVFFGGYGRSYDWAWRGFFVSGSIIYLRIAFEMWISVGEKVE